MCRFAHAPFLSPPTLPLQLKLELLQLHCLCLWFHKCFCSRKWTSILKELGIFFLPIATNSTFSWAFFYLSLLLITGMWMVNLTGGTCGLLCSINASELFAPASCHFRNRRINIVEFISIQAHPYLQCFHLLLEWKQTYDTLLILAAHIAFHNAHDFLNVGPFIFKISPATKTNKYQPFTLNPTFIKLSTTLFLSPP